MRMLTGALPGSIESSHAVSLATLIDGRLRVPISIQIFVPFPVNLGLPPLLLLLHLFRLPELRR